jgi:NADPH:quinone reductase-like Zn-dependent oxidoreductase
VQRVNVDEQPALGDRLESRFERADLIAVRAVDRRNDRDAVTATRDEPLPAELRTIARVRTGSFTTIGRFVHRPVEPARYRASRTTTRDDREHAMRAALNAEGRVPELYTAMVMREAGALPEPVERVVPEPGPGEAIVRVAASSMNYHDLATLKGWMEGPWPRVPMSDGAGTVVAVGEGVTEVAVGDRVIGTYHPAWLDGRPRPETKLPVPGDTCDGWLEQYHPFPARSLVGVPSHLTDAEAATLPCAGTTAFTALAEGKFQAGDVVVTQGTGGVSLLAVQLAKAAGATVILTSSSDDKLAIGAQLGADHLVNYRTTPDWDKEVLDLTDGLGADIVLDVGGASTLGRSVRATRVDGTVAIIGVLGGVGKAEIPVRAAITRNTRLVGVTTGSVRAHRGLCAAVAAAGIRPHISHVVAWDELPEAMRIMQAGEHVGKIAVIVP